MSGIKTYTQFDMRVAPTEENHLVRLDDMIHYVAGKIKNPVRAVLNSNFAATYEGTGKTLTQSTPAEVVIDGVTLVVGDRALIAGQTDKTQNGVYVMTTAGVTAGAAAVFTRAADFDENPDIIESVKIPVSEGVANHDSTWVLTTDTLPIVLDSTNLEFARDSGSLARVEELAFTLVGDNATSAFTFSHNLNTLNITHEIYDSNGETVVAQFQRTSVNDVKVTLGEALATGDDLTLVVRARVAPV
jgi:hypothetical protein